MQKVCPVCGKRFSTNNKNQKYCNTDCKNKMRKKNHGDKKKTMELRFSKPGMNIEKIVGLTEHEIRLRHDNMFKIKEGCKKLIKGRYLIDQQMRELCQISPGIWKSYSEHPNFENYRMKLTGTVYWGHPSSIRKMKEELNATG